MAIILQSRPVGSSAPWSTLNSYREANASVPERDTAAKARALREIRTRAAADAHSWDTNYHHGSREYRVHDTDEKVPSPKFRAHEREAAEPDYDSWLAGQERAHHTALDAAEDEHAGEYEREEDRLGRHGFDWRP